MTSAATQVSVQEIALLIDYDNVFPPHAETAEQLVVEMNRWVSLASRLAPSATTVWIRLYGGWREEGSLTKAGSILYAMIPRDFFPIASGGPGEGKILRGSVELVTRLVDVPTIDWNHTFRSRQGLPRLRLAERPRPAGCANQASCPIDALQRLSRRKSRKCQADGCAVSNESAFLVVEQKMVDALLSCDAIQFARRGVHVVVISNDLDVLPGVATTASISSTPVTLIRGPAAGPSDNYSPALESLGVEIAELDAA